MVHSNYSIESAVKSLFKQSICREWPFGMDSHLFSRFYCRSDHCDLFFSAKSPFSSMWI